MNILAVFIGGGIGAVLRYMLSGAVYRVVDPSFPHGTLVVNVVGSIAIGLSMAVFEGRFSALPLVRIFLTVGILGGFTTFSSFSYETVSLLRDGETLKAILNITTNVVLCLSGTIAGMFAGRLI